MSENKSTSASLTHLDEKGQAHMVDVSGKAITTRVAIAQSKVLMKPETLELLQQGNHKKGDVLAVARIAGIQAAKKCSDLIPLCHSLSLSSVAIDFELNDKDPIVLIRATCKIDAKTGVEMEALTAVSIAALTIYDMCKSVDKGIRITETCLLEKSGGQSGDWVNG